MTRFLPYTVHFEIDTAEVQSIPQDTATSAQSTSTPSTTASSTQLSILPSLSKQPRPAAAIPDNKQFERSDTPEGFFYNKRNSAKSEHQFIQPISKISKMESSVVDSKKPNEGMGLPGFSRSQVNLANSTPNLARVAKPLAPPPLNRGRSSFSKALFTFHGNSSATSLLSEDGTADSSPVILPSSLEDDFDQNFHDMVHGKSRLAPFGGPVDDCSA